MNLKSKELIQVSMTYKIEIIENAQLSVLVGVFYQSFGTSKLDEFYRNIISYRNLPKDQKENSPILKNLILVITEIISYYPDTNIQETLFLITKNVLHTNRNLLYPKENISENNNIFVKIIENLTNLYFQKNALDEIEYNFTDLTRIILILDKSDIFISFTEEKINGVSYKLSNKISSNFNKKLVGKLTPGFYKIDNTKISGADNNIFYKLNLINRL